MSMRHLRALCNPFQDKLVGRQLKWFATYSAISILCGYVVASFGHWLGCIPLLIDSSGHRPGHEPADAPVLLQRSRVHSFVRRHFALRHIVLRLSVKVFQACLEPQTSVGLSINLSSMFEGNPLMRNTPQKTWFRGPFWGMFSIGAMGFLIFGVVAEEHAECWT